MNQLSDADATEQTNELDALVSIYSTELTFVDLLDRVYSICVSPLDSFTHVEEVILEVRMCTGYPSVCGPEFQLLASWLREPYLSQLSFRLTELVASSIGTPAIYHMVEAIRSFLEELEVSLGLDSLDTDVGDVKLCNATQKAYPFPSSVPNVNAHLMSLPDRLPLAKAIICPSIFHGASFVDRKSAFQAHCCQVSSVAEVSAFISTLLEDRKISVATHNILAWKLYAKLKPDSPKASLFSDCDDDGEHNAGSRLLHLLTLAAVDGVALVVSRWYGGIQLGPDRFKHINNVARDLLAEQNLLRSASQGKKGKRRR